jgi:hypothetical protein
MSYWRLYVGALVPLRRLYAVHRTDRFAAGAHSGIEISKEL